ncbi:MAG TPA: hypothetical protein VG410_04200 [Solirubrobacteraceae bacterium]|jgi:hypothetical protein|nr:hypothetical protein [Solirubrobacteraceae bacterium]
MPDKREAERLRDEQARREETERELAEEAPEPAERAQHERRSEKADYLREKLEEQADSPDQTHDS